MNKMEKISLAGLVIATLGALGWSAMLWNASGFMLFDMNYLNFKVEALEHPDFYKHCDSEAKSIVLQAVSPGWVAAGAWMAVAFWAITRTPKQCAIGSDHSKST